MLSKEIIGIIKSKRNFIFIILIMIIPLVDTIQGVFSGRLGDYLSNPSSYSSKPSGNLLLHPAFASFLSATTHGHLWQMIVVWLLPVFILNMFSDGYVLEKNKNYTNFVYTRCKKKKYMCSKYFIAYVVPSIVLFISLLLNFGIVQIIYSGGTSFGGLEIFKGENNYLGYELNNPNQTYFIYIIMASLCAGFCGVLCQSMSFIFEEYKKTYAYSFLVWIIFVICPYSVTYLFQPFIEYGISYLIIGAVILLGLVTTSVFISFCRVKRDEI